MKDRTAIWVLEYIIGGLLVVLPMAGLFFLYSPACVMRGGDYMWSTGLFIVSLGVILIWCKLNEAADGAWATY